MKKRTLAIILAILMTLTTLVIVPASADLTEGFTIADDVTDEEIARGAGIKYVGAYKGRVYSASTEREYYSRRGWCYKNYFVVRIKDYEQYADKEWKAEDFPGLGAEIDHIKMWTSRERGWYGTLHVYLRSPSAAELECAIAAAAKLPFVSDAEPAFAGIPQDAAFYVGDPVPGDVNGDGKTNSRDVLDLMFVAVEKYELSFADLNSDGKVNSRDVIALMKLILASK